MQLKYFMRGVGTGVLFTLFVFLVIIIPNLDLESRLAEEDKKIEEAADKDVSNLLGNKGGSSSGQNTPSTAPSTVDTDKVNTPAGSGTDAKTPVQQEPKEASQPAVEDKPVVTPKPDPTATPVPKPTPTTAPVVVTDTRAKAVIRIESGTTSEMFCRELEAGGIVDSWRDINSYIIEKGFDRKIRNGTYTFTEGMTYDDICTMVTVKPQ